MRVYARHGVLEHEQLQGQLFEVTVQMQVDYDGSDRLESTVNYAEVADVINKVMQETSQLIEHAAWRLVQALRGRFPQIQGGEVTLTKLNPPMPATLLGGASVKLKM